MSRAAQGMPIKAHFCTEELQAHLHNKGHSNSNKKWKQANIFPSLHGMKAMAPDPRYARNETRHFFSEKYHGLRRVKKQCYTNMFNFSCTIYRRTEVDYTPACTLQRC